MRTTGTLASRWLVLGFVLAAVAPLSCGREPTPDASGGLPPVVLPVAENGVRDQDDDPDARLIVTLTKGGEVLFDPGQIAFGDDDLYELADVTSGLTTVTLEELSEYLQRATMYYGLSRRKRAQTGDVVIVGGTAIPLWVLLRADKDAPWAHVQWLTNIIGERRIYRVQLGVKLAADRSYSREEAELLGVSWAEEAPPATPQLEGKLQAFLPNEAAIDMSEEGIRKRASQKRAEIKLHVAGQEVKAVGRLRDGEVNVPGDITYRVGKRETRELAEVENWVKEDIATAKEEKCDVIRVRVTGDLRVPFKFIAAVLDRLSAAGVRDFEWWGLAYAPQELRDLRELPYPDPKRPETVMEHEDY